MPRTVLAQRPALAFHRHPGPEDENRARRNQESVLPSGEDAYPADFIGNAPVVIVVCVETERSYGRSIENATLAASFIMLAAAAFGLGSAYLTACRSGQPALSEEIRLLLDIPAGIEPITVVPLGYPGELPTIKDLRPLKEIVHHGRFNSRT